MLQGRIACTRLLRVWCMFRPSLLWVSEHEAGESHTADRNVEVPQEAAKEGEIWQHATRCVRVACCEHVHVARCAQVTG